MKLSARNVLSATVKTVTPGAVDTEVIVEVAPGIEIVSIITKKSAESLGLKPGAKAYAVIKAPSAGLAGCFRQARAGRPESSH